eukprot:gnl/TRDRNA2_/TRDRNA2_81264_c0_seq1.p2 gnl/TRDRNA2_/TRDRNA2_81264_c0~~gnl/TRDRNA2_/TRDRNA2_81264_c0_seq1.p2  ORF type:complete len:140 (+),score=15.23 gnl/TRDRNA2_/TRDRNA2_81264_c0_seq1:436-855(+)
MGPTFFCPCTHTIPEENLGGMLAAAALKHGGHGLGSVGDRRCIGHGYSLKTTPAGTITIYDGSVFHGGLAHTGTTTHDGNRLVLNLNFAAQRREQEQLKFTENMKNKPAVQSSISAFRAANPPEELLRRISTDGGVMEL